MSTQPAVGSVDLAISPTGPHPPLELRLKLAQLTLGREQHKRTNKQQQLQQQYKHESKEQINIIPIELLSEDVPQLTLPLATVRSVKTSESIQHTAVQCNLIDMAHIEHGVGSASASSTSVNRLCVSVENYHKSNILSVETHRDSVMESVDKDDNEQLRVGKGVGVDHIVRLEEPDLIDCLNVSLSLEQSPLHERRKGRQRHRQTIDAAAMTSMVKQQAQFKRSTSVPPQQRN